MIGIAAPSGVISAMMAQMFDTDYLFSTRIVAVTTLLSAITMPLLIAAAEYLWGGPRWHNSLFGPVSGRPKLSEGFMRCGPG